MDVESLIRPVVESTGLELIEVTWNRGLLRVVVDRDGGVDQTLQLIFSNDPSAFIDKAASLDALSTREAAALRKVAAKSRRSCGQDFSA